MLDKLSLLNQTRSDGQVQRLCIITELCPKWKEMRYLMGVSACHLEAIKKNRRGEVMECCRFCDWLEQEGGGNYPVTWQGLCELLEVLEFSALAKQVQQFFNVV